MWFVRFLLTSSAILQLGNASQGDEQSPPQQLQTIIHSWFDKRLDETRYYRHTVICKPPPGFIGGLFENATCTAEILIENTTQSSAFGGLHEPGPECTYLDAFEALCPNHKFTTPCGIATWHEIDTAKNFTVVCKYALKFDQRNEVMTKNNDSSDSAAINVFTFINKLKQQFDSDPMMNGSLPNDDGVDKGRSIPPTVNNVTLKWLRHDGFHRYVRDPTSAGSSPMDDGVSWKFEVMNHWHLGFKTREPEFREETDMTWFFWQSVQNLSVCSVGKPEWTDDEVATFPCFPSILSEELPSHGILIYGERFHFNFDTEPEDTEGGFFPPYFRWFVLPVSLFILYGVVCSCLSESPMKGFHHKSPKDPEKDENAEKLKQYLEDAEKPLNPVFKFCPLEQQLDGNMTMVLVDDSGWLDKFRGIKVQVKTSHREIPYFH